ncbi:hypothetical protein PsYK624_088480 [Phanerochaete sordida]|uniref:Secreted protein n=1 Tax=Phanerochaete sordida TaxID=48140 RepID=A0A9P3GD45_9APHY|nr:hypothetical protein PsYK624_088480 [Phanerochaete sordida]
MYACARLRQSWLHMFVLSTCPADACDSAVICPLELSNMNVLQDTTCQTHCSTTVILSSVIARNDTRRTLCHESRSETL